jgi:hypothetical protein
MNKKLEEAFDERDYRFRRLELLIYGLYIVLLLNLVLN